MSLQSFVLGRINSIHEITAKHLYKDANTILLTRSILNIQPIRSKLAQNWHQEKLMTQLKRNYHIFTHIYSLNKTHPWWDLKVVVIGMRCLFFSMAACGDSDVYPSWQRQGLSPVLSVAGNIRPTIHYIYKNTTQRAHPLDVNLVHVHLHLVYIWSFDTVTGTAQLVPWWKYLPACSIWMHLHSPSCTAVFISLLVQR